MSFPADFVWGAATAAHQVEGGNWNSDCWALEHAKPSFFSEPSADGCDHLARYEDDIAILAGLGLNAYRFSIEWARVEPEEGAFSQAALDHYRRVIDACRRREVRPIATFHHFTNPRWVAREGGWAVDGIVDRFARYCERTAQALAGELAYACTINEINIPDAIADLIAFGRHAHPESAEAAERALGAPLDGMFLFAGGCGFAERALAAHVKAREAIKAAAPHVPVGLTLSLQEVEAEGGAASEAAAKAYLEMAHTPYYETVKGDDFLGVQTYTRVRFSADGHQMHGPPEGAETTQMGYEFRPEALSAACREAWEATQVPILITESGVATADDTHRRAFIRRALAGVEADIAAGVDIRGYVYWTLLDNFEWLRGYAPTFGLIGIDRASMARTIKPSAVMLGEIARANALNP